MLSFQTKTQEKAATERSETIQTIQEVRTKIFVELGRVELDHQKVARKEQCYS